MTVKKTSKPVLYRVRRSKIQGRGVFAAADIRKGRRIIEYQGEHISEEEADRRYDESRMKRHHTFLFTLDRNTVIDGDRHGNEARYINHSCDPNCEAVIYGKRIFIYSLRPIKKGEELLYDYKFEYTGPKDAKFYVCRCGAEKCRGTIMKSPPKKRKKGRKTGTKKGTKKSTKRKL